jgi:hypothetical protein
MSLYGNDKRAKNRIKLEFVVGGRTESVMNMAYTIDVSNGGVKIGSPLLQLSLGGKVELVIDKRGEKYPFSGRVARGDGSHYFHRINRSGNAFFISIDDARYQEFITDNYFV